MNEAPLPPITTAEGHDIVVFESVHELLDYIEWMDVEDGVYEAWDSLGRKIHLSVENEEIQLAVITGETLQADQLMTLLTKHVHSVGAERFRLFTSDDASLSAMLNVVLDFQKNWAADQPASWLRRTLRKLFLR